MTVKRRPESSYLSPLFQHNQLSQKLRMGCGSSTPEPVPEGLREICGAWAATDESTGRFKEVKIRIREDGTGSFYYCGSLGYVFTADPHALFSWGPGENAFSFRNYNVAAQRSAEGTWSLSCDGVTLSRVEKLDDAPHVETITHGPVKKKTRLFSRNPGSLLRKM